jgi:lipopolysaccharide/colanic/teichoic acid biosynthesis glycosyltransferase
MVLEPDGESILAAVLAPPVWAEDERRRADEVDVDVVASDYFRRKAVLVRLFGGCLLVPMLPIILFFMAVVRATSPGPAIYRQTRVGRDGKLFTMYKLRTMVADAEHLTGPVWCKRNDSRITPVGRMLRFFHLDELPQLWNVTKGEMDLVGPRPERPIFVDRLKKVVPAYQDRLSVLPGITGLAQINLPPDETDECVHRKLILDREYVTEADFWLDVRILACTALRMCGLRRGRAVRLFRLERLPELDDRLLVRPPPIGHAPQNGRAGQNGHTSANTEADKVVPRHAK